MSRVKVIEAELKARVRDGAALREELRRRAEEKISVYRDTYYDWPGQTLTADGRELRVRTVEAGDGAQPTLTYKEPTVDPASGSKPELETRVADASVIDVVLRGLGLEWLVAFEKHCTNYRFTARGRNMLATVVTVPGIEGTFVELETMAAESDTTAALDDVRAVLHELGVSDDDLTTELYTEAVIQARS